MIRSIFLAFTVLILTACGTTKYNYLDTAQAEINSGHWDLAYRLVEDGLITENAENRNRALSMIAKYPQLISAAEVTFSPQRVMRTMVASGSKQGANVEMRRLEMFSVIGSPESVKLAKENIANASAEHTKTEVSKAVAVELTQKEREIREAKQRADAERLLRLESQGYAEAEALTRKAAAAAVVTCKDALQCSKVFALTQIFITDKATMKIQTANDTILETYSPTEILAVGIRAVKVPRAGTSAGVVLDISCGGKSSPELNYLCNQRKTLIFNEFKPFIQKMLVD